jgi:hypothetical protein
MKVICEKYNRCTYSDFCSHSKEHVIINNYDTINGNIIGDANNCNLNHKEYDCFCSSKELRLEKLKKLNESNL